MPDTGMLNDVQRAYRAAIGREQAGTLWSTPGGDVRLVNVTKNAQVILQYAQGNYQFVPQAQLLEIIRQVHLVIDEEFKLELQKQIQFLTGTQFKSLAELARMGHPYGYGKTTGTGKNRKSRQPPSRPLQYINNQMTNEGAVMSQSWGYHIFQGTTGTGTGATDLIQATNTTPQSEKLSFGTHLMVARPFAEIAAENTALKLMSNGTIAKAKRTLEQAGVRNYDPKLPEVEFVLGSRERIGTVQNGKWQGT